MTTALRRRLSIKAGVAAAACGAAIALSVPGAVAIRNAFAIGSGLRARSAEISYPWCLQGSSLRCYYLNRQQCEESADFRGICERDPFNQQQPGGPA